MVARCISAACVFRRIEAIGAIVAAIGRHDGDVALGDSPTAGARTSLARNRSAFGRVVIAVRRRRLIFLVPLLLAVGCAYMPGGASVRPEPSPQPTSSTSPDSTPSLRATSEPSPKPSGSTSFYLRAWYEQSIPPQYRFSWLPPITVAGHQYINGNVAVPAIYPGPLMIMPITRSITSAGEAAIADRADELGLLEGDGDFTDGSTAPGSRVANVDIVIDGQAYHLVGPDSAPACDPAMCQPGTTQAFTTFWNELMTLDNWLPRELGPAGPYEPERIALRLEVSVDPPTLSPRPTLIEWPLDAPLDQTSCLTLRGDDLATMLPLLERATQLTAFYDDDTVAIPWARVLVPGEPELGPPIPADSLAPR
jgi:hypothetical protein